ncbi:NAD(P)-dependent oxidoreductase [Nocardia alni]|uniref:NAD(P)-dependent oxidoreductase n=1 Tax=Nocardia alni TaxID=2815723 RepID=UPI001C25084D|nr:NAD(P)-dependent oxidoreductase [Nocardia alni]
MKVAVIGMGNMGRALSERLLAADHAVQIWNRTPGKAADLITRGATELSSPDDIDSDTEAVFICTADDRSVLDVAAPEGVARAGWPHSIVAVTSTVSPQTLTQLRELYGDRLVAAPILGAPRAVASGEATFVIGGAAVALEALSPVWQLFAGPFNAGTDPARASVIKLLNNQLLMTGLAVVTETVRVARAAGIDDETLTTLLQNSAMMPAGLRNRIPSLFDPQHAGWFTTRLGAKDLGHFLGLAPENTPLPVTQAARDAYLSVADNGWDSADITALVELDQRPQA